jgi:small subunit ribosomal protein S9
MADELSSGKIEIPVAAEQPAPVKSRTIGPYVWGVGRRKKSIARVRIKAGTGKVLVNDRAVEEFFRNPRDLASAVSPLAAGNVVTTYDVWAKVNGGGTTGQADAVKLGISRALIKAVPELSVTLRDLDLLTRDARMKERKKYGQKGARKRFQFSKR